MSGADLQALHRFAHQLENQYRRDFLIVQCKKINAAMQNSNADGAICQKSPMHGHRAAKDQAGLLLFGQNQQSTRQTQLLDVEGNFLESLAKLVAIAGRKVIVFAIRRRRSAGLQR